MNNPLPHDSIVPFGDKDRTKKEQVADMFNQIAGRYDFLNRFLSGGIDVYWRKKAIGELRAVQPKRILDVATGTADIALMSMKYLTPEKIIGIDISTGMLNLGREKIAKAMLNDQIELLEGDSETINFTDNSFDAVTVAFGVRNFEHLRTGLKEMLRVLKPGGKLVILEFSRPNQTGFKGLYKWYMKLVAPQIGKLVSKNKAAYQYLNDSVQAFPEGEHFLTILQETGYTNTYLKTLSLGICTIYCGTKSPLT
ncbi:bifunctional demethylmenaquinone methyltransferase/2-methoxy-6-polyprenyl-1,4-benzoquinol methylase UbiE [Flavihumibacter fluvii]|uniref:bifunctional demethylmenaquinone methyltransferase/2-methoxy-6-polyprenyl-1,4-benzoquinol methylase UbiE n=1 Tax=Flavihumibacter fluvii TaxID=2838157 RepID=UPI001BDF7089|nr:bifunctional demethylmenaquinone methyltransferase/2-methoxy-6-polyprenyl-1,4-benzoquinol methylase UbiE [Flavihumibacter fluvii]ULQ52611.1 bifunctional demethylmenaquinone methyltransferase/2-methoxy-6-polyprenyl-1,4-benzoquinol methylase UbiE [Flavihumibacter fluvii]